MRCISCNKALTDYEATRRCVTTNNFLDMCNVCYQTISTEVLTIDRPDLRHIEETEQEFHDMKNLDYLTSWNENDEE